MLPSGASIRMINECFTGFGNRKDFCQRLNRFKINLMKRGLLLGLIIGLLGGTLTQAAINNIDSVPTKSPGNAMSALEFNSIIQTLVGIDRDDKNTSVLTDDAYGIGIPDGFSPSEKLEVNGNIRAAAFIGDGSLLTNVSATSLWSESGGNLNFGTGNVGIGDASPEEALTVVGIVKANNFMYSDGTLVSAGGGGGGGGQWTTSGSNIFRPSGYVGIGVPTPTQPLDIGGPLRGRSVVTAADPWDGTGVQMGGNMLGWPDQGGTNEPDSVNGAPDLWLTANNQVYVRSPGGLNVNQKVSSPSYCDENGLNCFGTPRVDLYKINTQTSGRTEDADAACQASGYQGFWAGMNRNGSEVILCYVFSGIPIYLNY